MNCTMVFAKIVNSISVTLIDLQGCGLALRENLQRAQSQEKGTHFWNSNGNIGSNILFGNDLKEDLKSLKFI